ncbi:5-methylaminomethyl-2-thiouridine methyltransferase [Rhizobium sp. Root149]|jgi:tRNA U34 5-methylaminomethyl-2-thiouridine-forming methyltransferase MnmC|uniref:tRNA (5-methylaminomethyl-2-thiouridine)(34)-methyltransferase MnmD n=1 Tax=Rhizobium TaxID=379 RepID=UPI0007159E7B|nr:MULTISPECIES: tRNA (5-methylaminomethyl-2-thiouridine)(34)-methyltransferase MnmD [Rhizobium]KQZ54462.1 5-methylaminomethyl-2-thiouridine methyltransferase [Rhizobium sp. Root149]
MTAPGQTENEATPLEWREGDMPYSTQFGDHFYCQTDGRLECSHVFLAGNGLPQRWQRPGEFRIGELGFGTGLNFCETWRQWGQTAPFDASLHFTSFELLPMASYEIDRALAHWPEVDAERKALAALWPERPEGIVSLNLNDRVRLTVVCGAAELCVPHWDGAFDAWFLDGFAPSRNPAMWSLELMTAVCKKTVLDGTFATYAAAGFVRRNLQAAGFVVERRPGFAGKREMLCGIRPSDDPA